MSTYKDNRKKSNLPIFDVKQRCFNSVKKILGEDTKITDANEWSFMDELDFIEIIMEVEKDFDCSGQINEDVDFHKFDTVSDIVDWLASNVA